MAVPEGKHGAVCEGVQHRRLSKEGLRQQDAVAAVVDEAILRYSE